MNDNLILQFHEVIHSRKILSNNMIALSKWISVQLSENYILCEKIRLVNRERNRLSKERQKTLSERARWRLGLEIQQLENTMEEIIYETNELGIVINEHINHRQEIWEKLNEVWEKQCGIWNEINQRILMQ